MVKKKTFCPLSITGRGRGLGRGEGLDTSPGSAHWEDSLGEQTYIRLVSPSGYQKASDGRLDEMAIISIIVLTVEA